MENNNDSNIFTINKYGYKITLEIIENKNDEILRIECEDIKTKDSYLIDIDNNKITEISKIKYN